MKVYYEEVNVRQLLKSQKTQLAHEMYNVMRESYEIVDMKLVEKHLESTNVYSNTILLLRDKEGDLLGYASYKVILTKYKKKRLAIICPSAYSKIKARGSNRFGFFLLKQSIKHNIKFIPKRIKMIGYSQASSPAPYYSVAKYFPSIYPNSQYPLVEDMPEQYQYIYRFMNKKLNDTPISQDGKKALIIDFSKESGRLLQNEQSWLVHDSHYVKFFIEANPGFNVGHALIIFAPCGVLAIIYASIMKVSEFILIKLGLRKKNNDINKVTFCR